MLYVLSGPTGGLIAWAESEAQLPPLPPSSVVSARAEWDAPPALPYLWSPSDRNWIVPAALVALITPTQYALRLTYEERLALEVMLEQHPDEESRAALRLIQRELDRATSIDVTSALWIDNTEIIVDLLIEAALVDIGDRQTRIDAILAVP